MKTPPPSTNASTDQKKVPQRARDQVAASDNPIVTHNAPVERSVGNPQQNPYYNRRDLNEQVPESEIPNHSDLDVSHGGSHNLLVANNAEGEPLVVIDPRRELEERNKKIEEEMRSSEIVAEARLMGNTDRQIRESLKRQYNMHGQGFARLEPLVDEILAMRDLPEDDGNKAVLQQDSGGMSQLGVRDLSTPAARLRALMMERMCKACFKSPCSYALMPCGHLCCCEECGESVERCPLCPEFVTERIRCSFT